MQTVQLTVEVPQAELLDLQVPLPFWVQVVQTKNVECDHVQQHDREVEITCQVQVHVPRVQTSETMEAPRSRSWITKFRCLLCRLPSGFPDNDWSEPWGPK